MDLIEALEAAEIDYHPGRDEDEIYLCCPFCTDQRFRLGVNVRNGFANCFNDGCGFKARGEYTFRKLQEALDTGEIEAKQRERKRKKKRMHERIELPEGFRLLTPPDEDNEHWNRVAWSYVRSRGVTREQIVHKKIGYSVLDPFAYRVVFPVYLHGVLVGLVGRDFTGKQDPKYKNSVGDKALYNLPEKKHTSVCLSESVLTALAIEKAAKKLGIDSCGLLGHSLTDGQLDLLKHYKRVYLWLDPDEAGVEGLIGITGKLKQANKSIRVILPKGLMNGGSFDKRDPDELETDEIVKRLDRAEVFTEGLEQRLKLWMAFDE